MESSGLRHHRRCSLSQGMAREAAAGMPAVPLRVMIADDDPFARRLIKDALQAAGTVVVAEAKDGREAVELAAHHQPDVVVMDVVMPGLDGVLATRRILEANPDQLVVVLTGAGEDDFGVLALQAGAVGFLSKDADINALPRALQGVTRGEGAISREMTRRLIARISGTTIGSSGLRPIKSSLTARMGGPRSARARPDADLRRRDARPLPRDRAFPHQEHHAKARGPLAC